MSRNIYALGAATAGLAATMAPHYFQKNPSAVPDGMLGVDATIKALALFGAVKAFSVSTEKADWKSKIGYSALAGATAGAIHGFGSAFACVSGMGKGYYTTCNRPFDTAVNQIVLGALAGITLSTLVNYVPSAFTATRAGVGSRCSKLVTSCKDRMAYVFVKKPKEQSAAPQAGSTAVPSKKSGWLW